MLTLLSPAALWTLAALALPLALHLWRRPPRTVRLGSLRFVRAHPGRRMRDLRWREWWLLAVRLALLATLAGLLAGPVWQRPPPRTPQRWVLLDPTAVLTGAALARLRSVQTGDAETHWLTAGLPATAGYGSSPHEPTDLWSLLREADARLPAGSTLTVFSPARLGSLRGVRPALRAKVAWVETADADAKSAGRSSPESAAVPAAPLSALILHDPDRAEDARYLAAAIRAAVNEGDKRLDLQVVPITSNLTTPIDTDWTFWLAAAEPPAALEMRRTQLLRDAPHATEPTAGWIVPQPDTPGAEFLTPGVRLWQRGPAGDGATIWTDEHGTPLLTRASTAVGARWEFASRFHPAFNDLPRTTAFPAFVRAMILPGEPTDPRADVRLAAASQARPSDGVPMPVTKLTAPATTDLRRIFWTAAALMFVTERLLSHRR